MKKKSGSIFIISISIIVLISFFYKYSFAQNYQKQNPEDYNSKYPKIVSATVNPIKVIPGDKMLVKVEINDVYGITKVQANMGDIETIELELIEGNNHKGIWSKTWPVYDTIPKNYITTITALNTIKKTSSYEIKWKDPLSNGSICTSDSDCNSGNCACDYYTYDQNSYDCFCASVGNCTHSTQNYYDDFNDGNYTGWTVVNGTWSATNNYLYTSSGTSLITHSTTMTTGDYIKVKVNPIGISAFPGPVFAYQNNSNFYQARVDQSGDDLELWKWVSGSASQVATTNVTGGINQNTWYILEIYWNSASSVDLYLKDLTGNQLAVLNITSGLQSWTSGTVGLRQGGTNAVGFDNFVVKAICDSSCYGYTNGSQNGGYTCHSDAWDSGGSQSCTSPSAGNWVVNNSCTIVNEDNNLKGHIVIGSSGTLDLRGESALKFSGTNRYIYVNSGGTIYIQDKAGIGVPGDTGTGGVGIWSTTTALPKRIREHEAQTYKNYMYILGGVDNTGTTLNDVYYAPINSNGTLGSWTSTNTFTGVRRCHGSAVYNGYLYVLGGYNGSSYLSSVYYTPINSNGTVGVWSSTTSLTRGKCVLEATTAYQGYMYAVGGYYGSSTSEVHYAPINSNGTLGSWTATTSIPTASTYRLSAYRGYLYAVRNKTSGVQYYYAPINSDGSIGSWLTATPPSQSRQQIANLVTPGGYFYNLGGNTSSVVKDTVEYNLIGEDGTPGASWTATTVLPAVRRWGQAVYNRSYLYYLGGTDNTSGSFGYERDTVYYTQLTGDSPP